jgi:hypothetical protein
LKIILREGLPEILFAAFFAKSWKAKPGPANSLRGHAQMVYPRNM